MLVSRRSCFYWCLITPPPPVPLPLIRTSWAVSLYFQPIGSKATHGLTCVFPDLAPISCFSDAWYIFFLHFATVTCFPTLGPRYTFFPRWHPLNVFPRLASVTCFPALAWQRLALAHFATSSGACFSNLPITFRARKLF